MSPPNSADKGDRHVVLDEDNPEWTEEDFRHARPASELPPQVLAAFPRTRGRQKSEKKVPVSIRLSDDVLRHFKAGGPGWQTRIDEALRSAIGQDGFAEAPQEKLKSK